MTNKIKHRIEFWVFLASGMLVCISFGYYLGAVTR